MLAHNIKKSKWGPLGFDTLDIFTNDEIYCSGFQPTPERIRKIGDLIEWINGMCFSTAPACLFITRKGSLYWFDIKIHCSGETIFADGQAETLSKGLKILQSKLEARIYASAHYNAETDRLLNMYGHSG